MFSEDDLTTGMNIMTMRLDGDRKVESLVRGPANERNAEISPDGRWIAYQSDESGQYEIYVRPFPAVDSGRWQISTSGGTQLLWARSFAAAWSGRSYDISLDDQRFLMPASLASSDSDARPARFIVVQNWFQEVERLVPTN